MKYGLIRLFFFLLLSAMGFLLVSIAGCSHVPAPSPPLSYQEGLGWAGELTRGAAKDYEFVRFMDEQVAQSDRDGFATGFVEGYGQNSAEMIAILFEAVDSDEFEEGKKAGEKLRREEITDEWIRDAIMDNQVKSEGKRLGWRCGFVMGYQDATHSYEDGEAMYRSIESSIPGAR